MFSIKHLIVIEVDWETTEMVRSVFIIWIFDDLWRDLQGAVFCWLNHTSLCTSVIATSSYNYCHCLYDFFFLNFVNYIIFQKILDLDIKFYQAFDFGWN